MADSYERKVHSIPMFSSSALFIVSLFLFDVLANELTDPQKCQLRCIAKCFIDDKLELSICEKKCENFGKVDLCNNSQCWNSCNDLSIGAPNNNIPMDISYSSITSSLIKITWNGFDDSLYLIQLALEDNFTTEYQIVSAEEYDLNRSKNIASFCDEISVRVASFNPTGVSSFSSAVTIEAPIPEMSADLNVLSMTFINKSYDDNGYHSDGTIKLIFKYNETDWPLGADDLLVEPLFHMISCAIPDLSTAIPNPQFVPGNIPYTVESVFGADLMYRKCEFLYYLSVVHSKNCGTTLSNFDQNPDAMKTLKIDCSTVTNSPCPEAPKRHPPPLCGQVEALTYDVLNLDIDADNPNTDISVNISFRSTLSPNKEPLYFVAFYGNAQPFERQIDVDLLGVDMIDILGNATNCLEFNENGTCAMELNPVNVSLVLNDLRMDTLYGVMICAVMDVKNLTFPSVNGVSQGMKTKANKIYIDASQYKKSKTGLIIGIICGIMAIIFLFIGAFICYIHRKQKQKIKMNQFKLQQLKLEIGQRYTDFPRKQDLWELERRNLIIYDDKKLGSGAFGAVYMGRLIGVAKGHKDAQSTLGINLMRAENCDVAVKMLPEYADQISKSEFLKEISLMKTLGYHERLVNMLACITDSEPYCLIVEYCSDGDLLHFLRERCNYMLKLTDMQIDYDNPKSEADFDIDMIITLKQLLMFAVQISYGLEYLSQKGFVHRDVAARNILVHEKTNAKIGDFGLCRYIYAESANYKGKGGRLPVKWMSPEAIKHYEFTTKSDVWSFGILMFEIITLGGSPYPGVQPDDMMDHLDAGERMEKPDNCPDNFYEVMKSCWEQDPMKRPEFGNIRQKLASQLEEVTDEYSYLKLDSQRDYYNVTYGGNMREQDTTTTNPMKEDTSAIKEISDAELVDFEDIPLSSPFDEAVTVRKTSTDRCAPETEQKSRRSSLYQDDTSQNVAAGLAYNSKADGGEVNSGFVG
uniref:Tyrosine-protein kinase n=1 Tax=Ascaris suum TaxID=6253 RepID=F1KSW7_ASCSU